MSVQCDNVLKSLIKLYGGMILQKEWDNRGRSWICVRASKSDI